jgi:hypothetical protein
MKKFKLICLLCIIHFLMNFTICENIKDSLSLENQQEMNYRKSEDYVLTDRSTQSFIQNGGILSKSMNSMYNNENRIINSVMRIAATCPCQAQVRCKPCGLMANPDQILQQPIGIAECPCAPRVNCPICPPLSLIHEIASKKVSFKIK